MQENKLTIRGELSLLLVIIINSLGVVLMLHSGSGISAISSVPYAFADVLPVITLGAWTEVFQVSLVLSLMLLSKRFVPVYLFSFVVGSAFSAMIDVHEMRIKQLPQSLTLDIIYFIISYIVICFGVALANRCHDLFLSGPRGRAGLRHNTCRLYYGQSYRQYWRIHG